MRIAVAIVMFLLVPLYGMAQEPHPILRSFTAIKQPNGVLLRWVIRGGQQCQGTWVHRANDSLLFEQINHVEGICGSFTEDETYTYFDNEPFPNTYNHYRLELGFQGFSDTVVAFFEDFGANEHLVQTNYVLKSFRILFSNDLNQEALLRVFDLSGRTVLEQTGNNSDFVVDPASWNAGIYVFRISGVAETDIHGKLYFSGQ